MTISRNKLTIEELEARWQQTGLSNDLMFRFVMENPDLCRRTLTLLLGKSVGVITEQQTQFSIETDGRTKGIRLDLFVEVDGEMIDVEIQTVNLSRKEMGHRLRFYQSEIDQFGIGKGIKYKDLKKSIIIFICTYDPFGKGAGRYTFEEICMEHVDVTLDDGATKIVYNTFGVLPEADKDKAGLECLFKYINGDIPEDDLCRDLDAEVQRQHRSLKRKGEFIMWEQIMSEREEAAKEEARNEAIIKLLNKKKSIPEIADWLDYTIERVTAVAKANGFA